MQDAKIQPGVGWPRGGSRRMERRVAVGLPCEMKTSTSGWRQVHLCDLSTHGCQVSWPYGAPEGTAVYIRIPGLALFSAKVRWARESTVGCQFENPLNAYVFEHIVGQSPAPGIQAN